MNAYIDGSVVLRLVLGQPGALREWRTVERGVASALVEVECLRTLDRLRIADDLAETDLSPVLAGGTLPGTARVAEIDRDAGLDADAEVLGHLCAVIPRKRTPELRRQRGHSLSERPPHVLGYTPPARHLRAGVTMRASTTLALHPCEGRQS